MPKRIHFLQDGWRETQESYDDVEDNCAPGRSSLFKEDK